MQRRRFLQGLAAVVASPVVARAEQAEFLLWNYEAKVVGYETYGVAGMRDDLGQLIYNLEPIETPWIQITERTCAVTTGDFDPGVSSHLGKQLAHLARKLKEEFAMAILREKP